ncbi:MAG TPA: sulfite exporter TauE/SafE family protein, partial [Rubrivivax sp.]|nr:sulfite exporter TauE/SafE family protein [Rubrivivax sp.]
MDSALIASAALLGLAGTPHCAAMCGAPCAALTGAGSPAQVVAFHLARVASYAVGGAVAASSMGALASLAQFSPALKPLWTLVHALAFALGLWLLWYGRQPAWMGS